MKRLFDFLRWFTAKKIRTKKSLTKCSISWIIVRAAGNQSGCQAPGKIMKILKEAQDYDAKIAHAALSRVTIDLDEGVKVNYEKVQMGPDGKSLEILAKL